MPRSARWDWSPWNKRPRSQGESVLDVGCGCGHTALALADQVGPRGSVTGIDISRPMLGRARERQQEQQLQNLIFLPADAQTHQFEPASVDLIFSRFGVMFFEDAAQAFGNLRTALRPGGRLCFLCWQELRKNDWVRVPLQAAAQHVPLPPRPEPGAPGPFSLADPARVRDILDAAGFRNVRCQPHETDMSVGGATGVDGKRSPSSLPSGRLRPCCARPMLIRAAALRSLSGQPCSRMRTATASLFRAQPGSCRQTHSRKKRSDVARLLPPGKET